MAFRGRLRRSLALLHMGFIFVRDKGFNECTPWPVQGWDMLLAARNNLQSLQRGQGSPTRAPSPSHESFPILGMRTPGAGPCSGSTR